MGHVAPGLPLLDDWIDKVCRSTVRGGLFGLSRSCRTGHFLPGPARRPAPVGQRGERGGAGAGNLARYATRAQLPTAPLARRVNRAPRSDDRRSPRRARTAGHHPRSRASRSPTPTQGGEYYLIQPATLLHHCPDATAGNGRAVIPVVEPLYGTLHAGHRVHGRRCDLER